MDDRAEQKSAGAPESLLELVDGAAESVGAGAVFPAFARAYYEKAPLDSLQLRTPQELLATVRGHFEFARRRAPAEQLLRALPPAAGGLACLETCVEDRPYLVDTIVLAVRGAGAAIDWMVHPVLPLRRDDQGRIAALEGDGALAESLIHVEFEALASAGAYSILEQNLRQALGDLEHVTADYQPMLERLRELKDSLLNRPPVGDPSEFAEARVFLAYLEDHHFTFLGYSETRAQAGPDGHPRFRLEPASGLGLLRPDSRWAAQDLIAPPAELDKYAVSPRLVVITKANLHSTVHRGDLMDVVSVKRFDAAGNIVGTARFAGLFSSDVYIDRPLQIPLIRRKAAYVLRRAGLAENSHSAKKLRDILHGLPRDELFQSGEEELFHLCMGIRALRDRQQLRAFMRRDRYGRFYSFLVYVPRERYSRELRDRIGATLLEICGGLSVDREIEFLREGMTRIHYRVRTAPGTRIAQDQAQVEQILLAATRSWRDLLRELLLREPDGAALAARFGDAFPQQYADAVRPQEALADIGYLARLSPGQPVLPRLHVAEAGDGMARAVSLTLYAHHTPAALSDVLPLLENFGLRVIRQEPTEITPRDSVSLWLQEFEISHPGCALSPQKQQQYFESAFLQVRSGAVENDGLNRLVLGAGLDARQVSLLRAICKYLIQTGLPHSQPYMEALLAEHRDIAGLLVRLFEARFALEAGEAARRDAQLKLAQALDQALDGVASLDGDRVLRAFLSVIRATLRSNYFQPDAAGRAKTYISFKLDPAGVPDLPLPRPQFEIWVYAPEVEGIHLRGGRVARGGLRWSDRRQDFRTEILGLMKAQMVKNTVIVPVGAKGGFVVKNPLDPAQRDAWLAQGIACYKTLLRGMLDLTDNRRGDAVVPPPDLVRYDADDPYLVVAADKGTATFSDIANGVAAEYGFWLGDAFASGGSAGFDHKKMGITARGAWEGVKRHFRELAAPGEPGRDIQTQEFSVVGIGDMSGDVFGNGMLLSRKLRLLAAFDHRHIFLDPAPDPEASFRERERLFALPRSSWADYDPALISAGGGVHPRSVKLIRLSEEARAALDIAAAALPPNELIQAILRAPVDLLWNGGIGTYVKAATQSALDVGDRANDAVRVNGRELRCKVVAEGGNLGFTQLGRIEYALAGGRINTDAIDNAGGVHTSDREVNIKIPLNELLLAGRLTRAERDPLLAECTADVAAFVLRDNYVQSAALSLPAQNALQRLDDHAELMRMLEREGVLNRALEFLPDDDALKERRARGLGLTRPELAVLLAYSKISLFHAVLESPVPDDPFFVRDLLANFPARLVARYRDEFAAHRLRREIVATILSNALVNRMGPGFAQLWAEDHGLTRAEVLKAYAAAHEIYGGDSYWRAIEALDNRVPAALQYRLMNFAIGLLKHATGMLADPRHSPLPVADAVARFALPVAELEALLPELLPPSYRQDWDGTAQNLGAEGVPPELARRMANTRALGAAVDIADLAREARLPLAHAAGAYFLCGEHFGLLWLYGAINDMPTGGKWQSLARVNLRDDLYAIHRRVAGRMLAHPGDSPQAQVEGWCRRHERHVRFAEERLSQVQASAGRDFATLAVAVREMRRLRRL